MCQPFQNQCCEEVSRLFLCLCFWCVQSPVGRLAMPSISKTTVNLIDWVDCRTIDRYLQSSVQQSDNKQMLLPCGLQHCSELRVVRTNRLWRATMQWSDQDCHDKLWLFAASSWFASHMSFSVCSQISCSSKWLHFDSFLFFASQLMSFCSWSNHLWDVVPYRLSLSYEPWDVCVNESTVSFALCNVCTQYW